MSRRKIIFLIFILINFYLMSFPTKSPAPVELNSATTDQTDNEALFIKQEESNVEETQSPPVDSKSFLEKRQQIMKERSKQQQEARELILTEGQQRYKERQEAIEKKFPLLSDIKHQPERINSSTSNSRVIIFVFILFLMASFFLFFRYNFKKSPHKKPLKKRTFIS